MTMLLDTSPSGNQDAPWHIAETDYQVQGTANEQLEFLVGYADLAPSRYDSRPWCFTRHDAVLELRLDQTRLLPVTDSWGREATMNCGTALYYLQVAMRHFGHTPLVEVLPEAMDTSLLARLRMGEATPPTEEASALFHAMAHRHTWEQSFRFEPIETEVFQSLHSAASREGTTLIFVDDEEHRIAVAEMVVEGERILQENPDYRQEALQAENRDENDWLGSMVAQVKDMFASRAIDPNLALEAPALAVLTTENDSPYDWLAAGQALGAILLTADTAMLQASFLNQPIEVLSLRPRLQRMVEGMVPQLILRLGYIPENSLTPIPERSVPEFEDSRY